MGLWVHNGSPTIDDGSQYPTIVAVCVTLTAWMLVIVCLRGYVRAVMLRSFGADDWTILFSAVCSVVYNGLAIGQSRWGLGLPLKLRPKMNLNQYSVINFAGRPFYMAGITGFKVALCLAYLRIVHQNNIFYKHLIWSILILAVLTHLGGTLVLIFQCNPIKKSWQPLTPGVCLRNDITFYVLAGITIVFDCIIFFLPIPLLARVKINRRRKIALIGVFLLGLFTTVCSVMRMVQIIQIAKDGNSTMLVLWGTVEMNVGIGLTCIPTLTPLFNYYRDRSTYRYGYNSHTNESARSHGTHDGHDHNMSALNRRGATTASPASNEKEPDGESQASMLEQGGHGRALSDDSSEEAKRAIALGHPRESKILKTTEVDVEVDDYVSHIGTAVSTPPLSSDPRRNKW
ncbi:MAG: hypothetical protein M1814_001504 [Vezdaea aestivalis]|nr:MAG: hypothetical protein M1814_001504 [Vezdaea aestivalis]